MTEAPFSGKNAETPERTPEGLGEPSPPISSGALLINLQRTALAVRIPEPQKLLLEIVESKVGIHRQTEALLREANHPYANWDELVESLRTRALGDFYYHNRHQRGHQALSIFIDLFFECLAKCQSRAKQTRAFASLLDFIELILVESGPAASRNRPVLEQAFARLDEWLKQEPWLATKGTPRLRKMIRKVLSLEDSPPLERLARLYGYALRKNYEIWLAQDDLEAWFLSEQENLFEGRDYGALFRSVSHARLQEMLSSLESLPLQDDGPARLPSALSRSLSLADLDRKSVV